MLVLDTNDLRLGDRIAAFEAVAAGEGGVSSVQEEETEEGVWKRLELWPLGPLTLFHTQGTGVRISRSLRQARRDAMDTVAINIHRQGTGGFTWADHQRRIGPNSATMHHMPAGYEYWWSGLGSTLALMFDTERLSLPEATIRSSIPSLQHSPIGQLLIHHVLGVHHIADQISAGPEADALASATVELVRAWVVSVAGDDSTRRAVGRETLLTRVLAYARVHLREPDLTPQRIAWAHNTSVRTLYRLCDDGGVSLEKWIIRRRLEGARADLAAPGHSHRTIESIARSWGFTNPAFFSRRFRQTYGTTPSQWRRVSRQGRFLPPLDDR
ncbi:AraC-like DNA-binding protein [Streptomyces sp. SAI-135]|uniref:helix-turn-helix domain-containing protein n=1 Tax=unclassified Streptomyces TaxID=2593676 RepID=UPI0024755590|nr:MULTISPECIES: helix-turn-helix domain-containing protein [unclassified Streptomyces]MDH6521622.1 AraC-like DNA-binding protein [Streptomyces sp. SAI-090]MDH6614279.1 AraC-like DNA-binding protein [Streptomyces sp. SAI-135]